ncbi:MAG: hypothetical protein A2901_04510 [Elusimicrobia bacterium RIFCSPLOWO2_01_FULL_54_10]|nr:MAG: hypothetical protein A2901_04510 [Elusimicrobia bacterium RIFCSPLOWO2_01_FULL_54_10]
MKKSVIVSAVGFLILACAQAQAMGRVPKKDYDAKVSELNACSVRVGELNENVKSLQEVMDAEAAAAKAKHDALLADMNASKSDQQKKLAQMTQEKEEIERQKLELEKQKQAEVDKLKNTYEDLMSGMKSEIEQGSIQITQLKDKLSVNMVDKILFNSGEADVNTEGKKVLLKVADVLKKVQNKQIRIEGHTDNVPIGGVLKEKFATNWELSAARATTVARYLTEVCGVNPNFVSAAGYGQFKPLADNANADGRSKNRRIEIALIPLEVR